MRFALAGAVALFDVIAGAAIFSTTPGALPWGHLILVAMGAFAVMSGGVLLGECFAMSRGHPSPYGAPPSSWLKSLFIASGVLIVLGVLLVGTAGRMVLFPVAGGAFMMLLSGGVLQRTDILECLSFGLTRGLMVLAGALIYPEAAYRLEQLSFYELPLLVASAVFLIALLGRALEPEPREARGAGILAGVLLLVVIALAGWIDRHSPWAALIWVGVFVLAFEQIIILWPAGLGKRRRIIRNLILSLPLGMEAAAVTAIGDTWTIGGLSLGALALAYFLVVSIEAAPVRRDTSLFAQRRL